jgi:hypothetical protein
MSNLDFYARDDQLALLSFFFDQGHCRVFESYSAYDCELRESHSIEELDPHFKLGQSRQASPPSHTA